MRDAKDRFEVVVERGAAAPPSTVWRCLTEPALLSRWLGARVSIAPTVGAEAVFDFARHATRVEGSVVAVEPRREIAFTWGVVEGEKAASMPTGTTRVTIALAPTHEGTRIALRHGDLPSEAERRDHEEGWTDYLAALARLAEGVGSAAPAPAFAPVVPDRIETPRLVLRPYDPTDGPALHEAVQSSVAELLPWLPWANQHATVEASTDTARRLGDGFAARADFTMGIFTKDGHRLVGGTGLHRVRWDLPAFEIGYWLRTDAAGKGYATESTSALASLCFESLGAARVTIVCDPANVRSSAVAERAGFPLEGIQRSSILGVDGRPRDARVYALVRNDWAAGRGRPASTSVQASARR